MKGKHSAGVAARSSRKYFITTSFEGHYANSRLHRQVPCRTCRILRGSPASNRNSIPEEYETLHDKLD